MQFNKRRVPLFLMGLGLAIGLASCGGNGPEAEGIKAILAEAEKMTEEELHTAALEEIADGKLVAYSQTSGTAKALAGFKEKYNIDYDEEAAKSTKKDYELYTALDIVSTGKYYADMVMIQDSRSLGQYMDEDLIVNYTPGDLAQHMDDADENPQACLFLNKIFTYRKNVADAPDLNNVWQLAGTEADANHIKGLSFQSPRTENINRNFLFQLASPEAVADLTAAYQSYYGKAYVEEAAYPNIGYKFIAEFIKNITSYHGSDTTAARSTLPADTTGTIFYLGYNKIKDLANSLPGGYDEADEIMAFDHNVEGFKGYMYKMYTVIPTTAKYPLASALFIRYCLTQEGFEAGWGGQRGYYSANTTVPLAEGDLPLDYWKDQLLTEDEDYLKGVRDSLQSFINAQLLG